MTFSLRNCVAASALATLALVGGAQAQTQKPNVLVIMGDDIGYWNISAYNRGMMGYRTPNIDRIANEGAIFTDYYGQQSCTAGRAAFIINTATKTSAPVYRLDVGTGKRELITTLAPGDSAGVTSIYNVRMTADGKSYGYSFARNLSDLFLVEGVK